MNKQILRFVGIMAVLLLGVVVPVSAQEEIEGTFSDQPDPYLASDAECAKRDNAKCISEFLFPGRTLRESIANARPWLDFPITEQEILDINNFSADMLDKKVTTGLRYKLTDKNIPTTE